MPERENNISPEDLEIKSDLETREEQGDFQPEISEAFVEKQRLFEAEEKLVTDIFAEFDKLRTLSKRIEVDHDTQLQQLEISDTTTEIRNLILSLVQENNKLIETFRDESQLISGQSFYAGFKDVDSVENLSNLEIFVSQKVILLQRLKQIQEQVNENREQVNRLIKNYKTVLINEAGYESIEEVEAQRERLYDKRKPLLEEKRFLSKSLYSRFKNRKRIKILNQQIALSNGQSEKLLFDHYAEESLYEEIDKIKISEDLTYDEERLVSYTSGKLIKEVNGSLLEYLYEKQDSLDSEERIEKKELRGEIIEKLNRQYLDRFFEPEYQALLDSSSRKRTFQDEKNYEWLKDPANKLYLESLVLRGFDVVPSVAEKYGMSEDSEDYKILREEVEKLPWQISDLVKYYFPYSFSNESLNSHFQSFSEKLDDIVNFGHEQHYKRLIKKVKDGADWETRSHFSSRDRDTDSPIEIKNIGGFIEKELDDKRWIVFSEDEDVKKLLGVDLLQEADGIIKNHILQNLISSDVHNDRSITLGWKLLNYKDEKLLPYVLINCYREPGHSGEYPFRRFDVGSEETEMYKYVFSLTEQERQQALQNGIPGLDKIFKTMEDNPETFLDRYSDTEGKQLNPAKLELDTGFAQMCAYYLNSGSRKEKYFALSLLKRLDVPLETMKDDLTTALINTPYPEVFSELTETLADHSWKEDTPYEIIESAWDTLDPGEKRGLASAKYELLAHLISKERPIESTRQKTKKIISEMFDLPEADMDNYCTFINGLVKVEGYFYVDGRGLEEKFDSYLDISRVHAEALPVIEKLNKFGYTFRIDHKDAIFEIIEKQDQIFENLNLVRQFFPDFKYTLDVYDFKYDKDEKTSKIVYITDPYEMFARSASHNDVFEQISHFSGQMEENELNKGFSRGYLFALRKDDPMLRDIRDEALDITSNTVDKFHSALLQLSEKYQQNKVADNQIVCKFLEQDPVLYYIARQPERIQEIFDIQDQTPKLMELLAPGGPLHSNFDNVIKDIFSNGAALRRAKEIEAIFTKQIPFWKQLFTFTDMRIGDRLANAGTQYPLNEVLGIPVDKLVKRHKVQKEKDSSQLTRLEQIVKNEGIREMLVNGELEQVPFESMNGIYKRVVLRDYLKRSIETSRDDNKKEQADTRNREWREGKVKLEFNVGDYLHASPIDAIESVLRSGNLPQECLGEGADVDSYPFQVDFTRVTDDYSKTYPEVDKFLNASLSNSFGNRGSNGVEGQIFYLYRRQDKEWEKDTEFSAGGAEHHALVLGGMPSTEISGIIVRNKNVSFDKSVRATLENGFYIPIYDLEGNLLFTPTDFDIEYADNNFQAPVEEWDFSMKTSEKLGSNPGGIYTVPGETGPVQYYVKYGERGSKEEIQMWTEFLCDELYRECEITVPESRIVKTGGSYGRASKMVDKLSPEEKTSKLDLKSGFVVDILTQNYWDLKPENVEVDTETGKTVRIDNGAAFPVYRGTPFNADYDLRRILDEALEGKLPSVQGGTPYEGLTRQEIEAQAQTVLEKLTPEVVEAKVNSLRLSSEMRLKLIQDINERVEVVREVVGV